MLRVGRLLEDISCLGWLELEEVAKDENRYSSKHSLPIPSELLQSGAEDVKEICARHADLVNYYTFPVLST